MTTTAEFVIHGDTHLALDVHSASPGAPVVLYLHGGAWVVGSRADHQERLAGLVAQGITVVSADYRLVSETPYPGQRDDIEAAVDWIIREGLAPDSRHIVIMGASAGAHLGALVCFTSDFQFAGFVGLFGRYDLSSSVDHLRPPAGLTIPDEIIANVLPKGLESPRARAAALAGVPQERLTEEALLALSPVSYLAPTTPPLLLLHGLSDALAHHDHAQTFAERARNIGIRCEVVLIPEANHEDPLFDDPRYLSQIARFVERVTSTSEREESK
ncbi:alpha/beta hydrolase [Glaciihabitans sp. UYNi722]|uniref:alpha/beta hydrolase n=1 Tax=Glaciihabitans sp. UYNi722 TaxID=3156344 RepID=UPI0033927789